MIGYWKLGMNNLSYGGASITVLTVVNTELDLSSPWGKASLLLVRFTWYLCSQKANNLHKPTKSLNCYNTGGQMVIWSLESCMLLFWILVVVLGSKKVTYSLMVLCTHPCNLMWSLQCNRIAGDEYALMIGYWMLEVNDLSYGMGGSSIAVLAALAVSPELDFSSPRGNASLLLVQFTWYLSS